MDHVAQQIERLIGIMAKLRDPNGGCPWDLEQSFETIVPYTIEEAYEVADAIERRDMASLKDELGDLLLQVVYHARMAEEDGEFAFPDVDKAISDKMIRRHPHVFGEATVADSADQTRAWEVQKAEERVRAGSKSVLAGVARGLPALLRAYKLQARAARVGFDWRDAQGALDKLREELDELSAEMDQGQTAEPSPALAEELGDVLFSAVNLARKLGIEPEDALRRGNRKFEKRFGYIERRLAEDGRPFEQTSLEEMETLWQQAKTEA